MTLVRAPAGWGKSTLLADWQAAASEPRPFAWLALDDQDNDPVRFWTYAIESLRTVVPEIGESSLALTRTPGLNLADVLVPVLVNELAASQVDAVFVLDDYHLITHEGIHEGLFSFVRHAPTRLELVVSTHVEPPFSLARLRASGDLVEVDAGGLSFSAEEATELLNDLHGLALEQAFVVRLCERTEGWAAGLYLAALSLRAHDDASEFVSARERLLVGERDFRRGDRVVCRRNCDLVGVRNGTRGTIEAIDRERGALTLLMDVGEQRMLPAWFLSAGFVEHGYALTGHAAQGATFERAFILASDEGALREWGYAACSRARSETHLYLSASGHEREANGRAIEETDATTRLADALARPAKERLAIESSRTRRDPREARRAHLEEAHARAEQRLAETRAEIEQLGWWDRRRSGAALRSELAFRQTVLDRARESLAAFVRESVETPRAQTRKPELSLGPPILERRREITRPHPEREPPGIDLRW